ncbi:MAG: hypothetical protein Q9M92_00520 [Enterobacterales bacterium]|nr:hypothetical protein [Enterobacterales bacterium]
MSYQLQECCFNLPRWEFSEQPLNPAKLAYGMQDKNLACVSIEQVGEGCFYALGLSDSALDSGKNSASAAFYFYCQANTIDNGLALLDLGGDKIWLGGVVKGRLWPSSDIIFQVQDIDYHIALFFDLIDSNEFVSLFLSQSIDVEVLLANGRQQALNDVSQIDLKAFVELIQPDQRSLLRPVKNKLLSFRALLWLAVFSASSYWAAQSLVGSKDVAPISSSNWNKASEKTDQQQQLKNVTAIVKSIVRQELIELAARTKASSLAAAQLRMLHQIISQQNIYVAGWDLKVAHYHYDTDQLSNFEQQQILELSYQRVAMGQVQEFIDFAMDKQLKFQVDLLGNIARVKLKFEPVDNISPSPENFELDTDFKTSQGQPLSIRNANKIENVLEQFNRNGSDYFKTLSRIQSFCYIWQSAVSCELKKPVMLKRASRIDYSELDKTYSTNEKNPLLSYKLLSTQIKGRSLNGLLTVSESLLDASSQTLFEELNYNFASESWHLTLETHAAVTKNLAKQYMSDIQ